MPENSEKPLAVPLSPLEEVVVRLALCDDALQATVLAMIRDPAVVSLVGHRVLQAQRLLRKARRLLAGK